MASCCRRFAAVVEFSNRICGLTPAAKCCRCFAAGKLATLKLEAEKARLKRGLQRHKLGIAVVILRKKRQRMEAIGREPSGMADTNAEALITVAEGRRPGGSLRSACIEDRADRRAQNQCQQLKVDAIGLAPSRFHGPAKARDGEDLNKQRADHSKKHGRPRLVLRPLPSVTIIEVARRVSFHR